MNDSDFNKLANTLAEKPSLAPSVILITVVSLIVCFFTWASFATLDIVTRGQGKIVSSIQNQLIQAAEGGVILARYVSENSIVRRGDVLMELDPIDASSELNRLENRLAALDVRRNRLEAEISGQEFAPADNMFEISDDIISGEVSLFNARKSELRGSIAILNDRLDQAGQELEAAHARVETARRTAELLSQEVAVVEPLVRENIAPATRLLELQRQLESVNGERSQASLDIQKSTSAISEIETQIINANDNYRLRAIDELTMLRAERAELLAAIPQLQERVSRTTIRSPIDGIVNQLNYRTIGGYVERGNVILELVPTEEGLVVEARIKPQDISRIRVNDSVLIRLSAYDSAKYGSLSGTVINISPDAVPNDDGTSGSSYLIDVSIDNTITLDSGEDVQLLPGMTATVDVLSGKRTVMEYIWAPVSRVQELALRDSMH